MTKFVGDDFSHSKKFRFENPEVCFGFSSLAEVVKHVENLPKHESDEGRTVGLAGFFGTSSIQEAFKLARDGWNEGAKQAEIVAESFETERAQTIHRSYSVAGGSASIGRMLAGNPEHMRRRAKAPGRKIVTLFSELSTSAAVPASALARRAAIVAAICDRLETAGYSCEIVAVCLITRTFGGTDCAYHMATILKNAGERLNISDLIFGLGHPSMLRRFVFSLVCAQSELRRIWLGQGCPTKSFAEDTEEFYLSSLSIEDAKKLQKSSDVKTWIETIAPKKLLDLLNFSV